MRPAGRRQLGHAITVYQFYFGWVEEALSVLRPLVSLITADLRVFHRRAGQDMHPRPPPPVLHDCDADALTAASD